MNKINNKKYQIINSIIKEMKSIGLEKLAQDFYNDTCNKSIEEVADTMSYYITTIIPCWEKDIDIQDCNDYN